MRASLVVVCFASSSCRHLIFRRSAVARASTRDSSAEPTFSGVSGSTPGLGCGRGEVDPRHESGPASVFQSDDIEPSSSPTLADPEGGGRSEVRRRRLCKRCAAFGARRKRSDDERLHACAGTHRMTSLMTTRTGTSTRQQPRAVRPRVGERRAAGRPERAPDRAPARLLPRAAAGG